MSSGLAGTADDGDGLGAAGALSSGQDSVGDGVTVGLCDVGAGTVGVGTGGAGQQSIGGLCGCPPTVICGGRGGTTTLGTTTP